MFPGHPEICLFEPEIPQNTGNIGRLAAATGSRLHLVQPFGFTTSDKNLRRSGLDYWPYLDLEIHESITPLLERHAGQFAFLSTKGTRPYTDIPPSTNLLIFGKETSGLPAELHDAFPSCFFRLPMYHPQVRSLNLANAVSIVVYDRLHRAKHADGSTS